MHILVVTITVLLVITRYLKALSPLWSLIPARWGWLPPALVAATGAAAESLQGGVTLTDKIEGILIACVVPLTLAFMKGHESPANPAENKQDPS